MRKHAMFTALAYAASMMMAAATAPSSRAEEPKVEFIKDVKPILESRCVICHGADPKGKKPKGKYDLTTKDGAMNTGEHKGKNIVTAKAEESLFYTTLLHAVGSGDDEIGRMPYKKDPLPKEQINLLKNWIDQGAAWPDDVKKLELKE